jgi:steroid 5-alpha reductase family enzyme
VHRHPGFQGGYGALKGRWPPTQTSSRMFDLDLYGTGLGYALGLGILAWLIHIPRKDAGVADSVWPLSFVVMTGVYTLDSPMASERAVLVLFLVTLWAARLSAFVTRRNWGRPEDRRYAALRAEYGPGFWWKGLYLVFSLQAVLSWIISLPLLTISLGTSPLGWLDYLALGLWLVGLFFEAVGDQQLSDFRSRPGNQSRVMDRGLWRFTRHPNYFGEACIWWAFYIFSVAAGGWWTIVSPILVTWMLLRVSGVTLLERDIAERRPAYRRYMARTNAFFPGPRRSTDRQGI